jgi:hypothetical protein
VSLPLLCDITQVESRLGQPIADLVQAESLIGYASSLIRRHTGRTYTTETGELDDLPDGVAEVCVEVVVRAVMNPSGATQDTAGPFTVSFGPEAAQRLYLSKADRIILGAGGLSTIRLTGSGALETAGPRGVFDDDWPV